MIARRRCLLALGPQIPAGISLRRRAKVQRIAKEKAATGLRLGDGFDCTIDPRQKVIPMVAGFPLMPGYGAPWNEVRSRGLSDRAG
jgi:hypothetical protein